MRSRVALGLCVCVLWSCGGTGAGSSPGPLVDNTKWVWTIDGEELFGTPPPDSVCELMPIECDEFPWPADECVTFEATSTCIASFVPECWPPFTVIAVYTRMRNNPTIPLCNWITLEQPSLRAIRAGDEVEVRMRHAELNAPVPGKARMSFAIGDQIALDEEILIPSDFAFPSATWTAPEDYPAGTRLLFHVDNHGANEYMLIEVRIL